MRASHPEYTAVLQLRGSTAEQVIVVDKLGSPVFYSADLVAYAVASSDGRRNGG